MKHTNEHAKGLAIKLIAKGIVALYFDSISTDNIKPTVLAN